MKTKTITYHASINNGSFFQAYALQKTMIELGHDNEILDIQTSELKSEYALFRKIRSVTDVAKNIISLMHYSKLKNRKEKFDKARQDYLKMSKKYDSLEEYLEENKPADNLFIAGSDQIWNTTASDFSDGYFLPGIKNKITYSVSGGSHISVNELRKYQKYISEFKKISVREDDFRQTLHELGNEDIQVTVDPTLLLIKDDYLKFISSAPFIKGKYIFLYSVKCDPEVMRFAKTISKETGLPIYALFNTYRSEKNRLYGVKNIYDAGPFDFLNIIENAEFVLTDSFHGTVFSILMEKEFYYISKMNVSGCMVRDDRIDGLLENLCLDDRKIFVKSVFQRRPIERSRIENINLKIQKLRSDSINYLKKSIGILCGTIMH